MDFDVEIPVKPIILKPCQNKLKFRQKRKLDFDTVIQIIKFHKTESEHYDNIYEPIIRY